jgi:hypothetical protein
VALPFTLYHENVTPDGERLIDLSMTSPVSATGGGSGSSGRNMWPEGGQSGRKG